MDSRVDEYVGDEMRLLLLAMKLRDFESKDAARCFDVASPLWTSFGTSAPRS